ncbi:hypothetical protein AVEN_113480-1, partial [Araneus ventricosus]
MSKQKKNTSAMRCLVLVPLVILKKNTFESDKCGIDRLSKEAAEYRQDLNPAQAEAIREADLLS